jgi:hypothetical protein
MKKPVLFLMIAGFLVIGLSEIQAQTTQPKLNQVDLFKQFIGTWEGLQGKDTIINWNAKAFGTGLECYVKFVTKGKIILEQKQIWGYDSKLDKFIGAILQKGQDIFINAWWFTSKNEYASTWFKDISNLENASWKEVGDCKLLPDTLLQTTFVNGKAGIKYVFWKVK